MADALWTVVLLLFSAHSAVSGPGSTCGTPTVYPDKVLEVKYAGKTEFNDGAYVRYKCHYGYTASQHSRASYCENGEWSQPEMRCKRKTCGSAGEIVNGRFRQNGNAFGDKAYAECNEGYVLQGEAVRECLVTGWSGTIPTCVEAVVCTPPKDTKNLTFYITKATYKREDTVSFSCNLGYQQVGNNNVLRCERSGNWSSFQTYCQRIKCDRFTIPNGGKIKFSHLTFDTKVNITCQHGYRLRGPSVVTCGANRAWTPGLPTCEKGMPMQGTCPTPVLPNGRAQNGRILYYKVGKPATIVCQKGFVLIGSSQVTCGADGQWKKMPECRFTKVIPVQVTCPPPVVPNSRVQNIYKREYKVGEQATVFCQEGFELIGLSQVTCGADGQWQKMPECRVTEVVTCPSPVMPNSRVQNIYKREYKVGEQATIICLEGFELIGSSRVTCGADGQWQEMPECRFIEVTPIQVTCPPPVMPNSRVQDRYKMEYEVGEQATIICQEGFELIGSTQVTCGVDGQWQEIPQCRLPGGKCQPPPFYPNAHTMQGDKRHYEPNDAVRFKCNHGYRMVRGPSTIYCRNGQWTALEMTCERKHCGSAGEIDNGRYYYTGSSFGDTATARCNEGYQLVGMDVRNCRANGWDGRAPVCEAVQCPEPPKVPDADVFFNTGETIKFGYVATYTCHTGRLIGNSEIICSKDGTWSGETPRCEVICFEPRLLFGSVVSGWRSVYQPGNSVTFSCNPGRRLTGANVITCGRDGQWRPRPPQCLQWYTDY